LTKKHEVITAIVFGLWIWIRLFGIWIRLFGIWVRLVVVVGTVTVFGG
jgi:hypothetical protein